MAEAANPTNDGTDAPAEEAVDTILEEAVAALGADMPGVPAQEETVEETTETVAEDAPAESAAPETLEASAAPETLMAETTPTTEAAAPQTASNTTASRQFRPSKELSERIQKNRADVAKLQAKIKGGEYSAIEDGAEGTRLQLEAMELRDSLDNEREEHNGVAQYWDNFAKANPTVGVEKGQKLYEDAYTAVRKRYPNWSEAQIAGGAAIVWENMVEKAKTAAPPPPKAAAPKIPAVPATPAKTATGAPKTAARTGFAPSGRTGAPKPRAAKDPADEFGEYVAKNGLDLGELTNT